VDVDAEVVDRSSVEPELCVDDPSDDVSVDALAPASSPHAVVAATSTIIDLDIQPTVAA
jgi:hypothetical protein